MNYSMAKYIKRQTFGPPKPKSADPTTFRFPPELKTFLDAWCNKLIVSVGARLAITEARSILLDSFGNQIDKYGLTEKQWSVVATGHKLYSEYQMATTVKAVVTQPGVTLNKEPKKPSANSAHIIVPEIEPRWFNKEKIRGSNFFFIDVDDYIENTKGAIMRDHTYNSITLEREHTGLRLEFIHYGKGGAGEYMAETHGSNIYLRLV